MQFNIISFGKLKSTNDEAVKSIYSHGDVIMALNQTNGRGQRGNVWSVEREKNLTCTFVLEPSHILVYNQFILSMVTSLACFDTMGEFGVVDCRIKWPNDIYVSDMKIGGILIEHHSKGEYLSRSILGVGINVNQLSFNPDIPNPTSLLNLGINSSIDDVLGVLCTNISMRYGQSIMNLHLDFMQHLWRATGFHSYQDIKGIFSASIHFINPHTGELTLLDTDGKERKYWFKEVESMINKV